MANTKDSFLKERNMGKGDFSGQTGYSTTEAGRPTKLAALAYTSLAMAVFMRETGSKARSMGKAHTSIQTDKYTPETTGTA